MDTNEILAWASAHHWATLSVRGKRPGTWEPIGYGELKWRREVMQASPDRRARIVERIREWNNLEQQGKGA
jgi:hypothetical protein